MSSQQELIPGTNRDHTLSQFFTPPKLAAKLVEWAHVADEQYHRDYACRGAFRVLEPSAGNGAIVRELVKAGAEVHAVEIDERYHADLKAIGYTGMLYCPKNFMECGAGERGWPWMYDLCVGNFPFHLDLDGGFTLHALKFAPRVCAIYPSNFYFSEKRIEFWKHVRPTRIANIARRPWEGATDYVALELVKREEHFSYPMACELEQWTESWG